MLKESQPREEENREKIAKETPRVPHGSKLAQRAKPSKAAGGAAASKSERAPLCFSPGFSSQLEQTFTKLGCPREREVTVGWEAQRARVLHTSAWLSWGSWQFTSRLAESHTCPMRYSQHHPGKLFRTTQLWPRGLRWLERTSWGLITFAAASRMSLIPTALGL